MLERMARAFRTVVTVAAVWIRQRKSIDDPADRRHAPEYEPRREVGDRPSPLQSLGNPAGQSKKKEPEPAECVPDD
jgi:hypothetical protein